MGRSKSSKKWLQEHFSDPFVKQAQAQGYRSRAAYKLLEIQKKDHLLQPGMKVVDLGAAPGGWSQVARQFIGARGTLIAVDILPMDQLADVTIIEGDFREQQTLDQILQTLGNQTLDLVISDMAPNITGIKSVDHARALYLQELAMALAEQVLKPGGSFLVKVFQGRGFDGYLRDLRERYHKVMARKPQASRARSTEMYLLARGFKSKS